MDINHLHHQLLQDAQVAVTRTIHQNSDDDFQTEQRLDHMPSTSLNFRYLKLEFQISELQFQIAKILFQISTFLFQISEIIC